MSDIFELTWDEYTDIGEPKSIVATDNRGFKATLSQNDEGLYGFAVEYMINGTTCQAVSKCEFTEAEARERVEGEYQYAIKHGYIG